MKGHPKAGGLVPYTLLCRCKHHRQTVVISLPDVYRVEEKMSAEYCNKCGAALQAGSSYCARCGAPTASSSPYGAGSPTYVIRRESRAERRAERRQGPRPGYGGLVVATILVVVGLAIFFPDLPWQVFWGGLWILLGAWIAYAWTQRGTGNSTQARTMAS